jgi:hypothetical protein
MKIVYIITVSIFFSLCLYPRKTNAQDPMNVEVIKTTNFSINGKGTSDSWQKTKWIDLPKTGDKKSKAMHTKLKILYSDNGIYFLFKCEDQILNATLKSDFLKLWKEDVVEVFLWPNEREPSYFEYELSPLNFELPLLVTNTNGELSRWRPYMYENDRKVKHKTSVSGGKKKSKASIKSWTAEFFIPFKLLRPLKNISPKSGTTWRANFYRVDYDYGETSYEWRPVKKSFHEIDKFGTIVFK